MRACPNTQILSCRSETVVARETLLSLGVSWQVKAKLDYSRSWNASPVARQIERVGVEGGEWWVVEERVCVWRGGGGGGGAYGSRV